MRNQESNTVNKSDPAVESLDLDKLITVCRKSLPVVILLILISASISTIAIRYTKQLFQSSSVLQLDIKSEAKVLGFKSFDEDINNLAREIEIIKSKLFLTKVAESLDFNISYFQYGDVLFEERYKNSPFNIALISNSNHVLNKPVDLEILNSSTFNLKYQIGDRIVDQNFNFSDTIKTKDITFVASLTDEYEPDIDNRYFFTLNTGRLLISLYK